MAPLDASESAQRTLAKKASVRLDLQLIADMVDSGSRVLDIGCDDGQLLAYLSMYKDVDGRGVELSQEGVNACVANGLSVVQGDADYDLSNYPSGAFDYAILSQTIQATHRPRDVLCELVRIGRRAIVSLPNFGHWTIRWKLGWGGRMPVTDTLAHEWYETPNIHLCTIRDFIDLCARNGVRIEKSLAVDARGKAYPYTSMRWANLYAKQAVFLLTGESDG